MLLLLNFLVKIIQRMHGKFKTILLLNDIIFNFFIFSSNLLFYCKHKIIFNELYTLSQKKYYLVLNYFKSFHFLNKKKNPFHLKFFSCTTDLTQLSQCNTISVFSPLLSIFTLLFQIHKTL